jgi:hypothetical protein
MNNGTFQYDKDELIDLILIWVTAMEDDSIFDKFMIKYTKYNRCKTPTIDKELIQTAINILEIHQNILDIEPKDTENNDVANNYSPENSDQKKSDKKVKDIKPKDQNIQQDTIIEDQEVITR